MEQQFKNSIDMNLGNDQQGPDVYEAFPTSQITRLVLQPLQLGAVRVTLFCSLLITELEEQIALCDAEFT